MNFAPLSAASSTGPGERPSPYVASATGNPAVQKADLPAVPLTLEGLSVLHQMFRFRWPEWRKLSPARQQEIAVRLAVGARSRDILMQFLTEAVTLSIGGGVIGIGIGVGCSKLVTSQLGWPTLTSTDSIILAFSVSAAIGIFFGFYPARKASQLDPIDALRYE